MRAARVNSRSAKYVNTLDPTRSGDYPQTEGRDIADPPFPSQPHIPGFTMSLETTGLPPTPESQPSAPPPSPPSATVNQIKAASRDALAAFKSFATDPVGGLHGAYSALGDKRAIGVGLAFGVVSVVCFLLGGYLKLSRFMGDGLFDFLGFGGVLKCLLFAVLPFACLVGGSLGLQKIVGGPGGLGRACFIAGAALLPMSVWALLGGMIGLTHYGWLIAITVFAGCTSVPMLFLGYTRINGVAERVATLAVPAVILLTVFITRSVASSVVSSGFNRAWSVPAFQMNEPARPSRSAPATGGSISGTYAANLPDNTVISLTFRSGGRVTMKMTGAGQNETEEGQYQVNGNYVTVTAGDMPMELVRDGNTLSLDFGGMSLRLTKR